MRINQNELSHHGILGMKWGVRRYQPYPKGYKGDGKYTGPKTSDYVNEAIKSGNKKNLKSLRNDISESEYKKAYSELVAKGIKDSIDSGDVKKLKTFKNNLSKNDYKAALNKANFNKAINKLKGKKMAKYSSRLSDEDIRNANNRIQNLTNINRSMKSIRTDNSMFMTSADIAKKLGVIIGVSVAAKGAYEKFAPRR